MKRLTPCLAAGKLLESGLLTIPEQHSCVLPRRQRPPAEAVLSLSPPGPLPSWGTGPCKQDPGLTPWDSPSLGSGLAGPQPCALATVIGGGVDTGQKLGQSKSQSGLEKGNSLLLTQTCESHKPGIIYSWSSLWPPLVWELPEGRETNVLCAPMCPPCVSTGLSAPLWWVINLMNE